MRIEERVERAPVGSENSEPESSFPNRIFGSIKVLGSRPLARWILGGVCDHGPAAWHPLTDSVSDLYTGARPWRGLAVAKDAQGDAIDGCQWDALQDWGGDGGQEEEDKGDEERDAQGRGRPESHRHQ